MIIRLTRKWDWHSASVSLSPEVRDYAAHVAVFSFFGNSYGERRHSAYLSHICQVALLSGARVYEVARKCRSPLSYELPPHPHPPLHTVAAQCPFPRAYVFIYVLLPGNSMSLYSSNHWCWVRCCLSQAWTDKRFNAIWYLIVYPRLFSGQGRWTRSREISKRLSEKQAG